MEEFLLRVCWGSAPNHSIRRDEVVVDVGFSLPIPPPTNEEMQGVAFAAKMALIKALRARKQAAAKPEAGK